jgi:hypothetical protein
MFHLRTIRLKTKLSSAILPLIIALIFQGCNTGKEKELNQEYIQPALNNVLELYKLTSQSRLEAINHTYDSLEACLSSADSLGNDTQKKIELMLAARDNLAKYIEAFNEFHEEIFIVEDHLLLLEKEYKEGRIEKKILTKSIEVEMQILSGIKVRIEKLHYRADSLIETLYLNKPV